MSDRYRHVTHMLNETPWAITLEAYEALREIVAMRVAGEVLTADEIQARISAGPGRGRQSRAEGVAVLPLYGVLAPRANLMTDISGGTSLEQWGQLLDDLAGNPAVSAILLDVNSPGGSISLVPETAAKVRAAKAEKPVVAIANTIAGSAAYLIASQADELVVTPSGYVGSIGVYCAHDDVSGAMEQQGVRTTLISAGKYKVEGNPLEPLSDTARAAIQSDVDEIYGVFVKEVARGRGTQTDRVRAGFGEGRMVAARHAVAEGMADRVDTIEGALGRLVRGGRPSRGARSDTTNLGGIDAASEAQDGPQATDGRAQDQALVEATVRRFIDTQKIKEALRR